MRTSSLRSAYKKETRIEDQPVNRDPGPTELMLAKQFDPATQDPKGWLMSEKLDGVRCYWNGHNMYTRNGNLFFPPKWFKDQMPKDLALDGELWTKRDDFQNVVSIVRKQDESSNWASIKYMVYDAPGLRSNFKKRLQEIEQALS